MTTSSEKTSAPKQSTGWDIEITPKREWFDFDIAELWRYRDLIMLFVRRDFVSVYKQTILGPLWFFIQPLFSTIVFTIVFGGIASIPTDGLPQPLFYMAGVVLWSYFSSCMTKTSEVFLSNASIFGKVYFPRLIIPISIVITNLLTFALQFLLFILFLVYFMFKGANVHPGTAMLLLPLLVLQIAVLGLGCGILVSSLTTRYRDLSFVVQFGVQLWMYATPVVYPLSQVPEKWRWLLLLNPMTPVVETFRYAFLGSGEIKLSVMISGWASTIIIFFLGLLFFRHIEKTFMDTI